MWLQFLFIVLAAIQMKFIGMAFLVQLSANASGVSVVTVYSSSPTAIKRESRELKEQIIDMSFNGASVRDTARTLKIGINTVIRALKSSRPAG